MQFLGYTDVCQRLGTHAFGFRGDVFACKFVVDDDLAVAGVRGADGGDLQQSERRQRKRHANCMCVATIEPIWFGVSSSSAAGDWGTTAALASSECTSGGSEIRHVFKLFASAFLKKMMRMSVGLMPASRSFAMRAFTAG